LRTGAPQQALARCQRALALHERVEGAGAMDTARDEGCMAEAHLLLGEPDKALPLVERARARLGTSSLEGLDTAWYTFVLARTLRALNPPDRDRAAAMAEEARSRFKALGLLARPELEEVVAWQRREGLR
ncbi:tetratricopeptide repeat protein, partial [Pyxidicoccus sp. 3LG]